MVIESIDPQQVNTSSSVVLSDFSVKLCVIRTLLHGEPQRKHRVPQRKDHFTLYQAIINNKIKKQKNLGGSNAKL